MTNKQKDFISSREAAELLGVAVSTIQLWTNNGLLRAWTTAGGHRRIVRSSVDEMLNQQHAASAEPLSELKLSIVLVEDNPQQRRLYEKQLLAWNINTHVVTASNGYEGLIKIGHTIPDVIITDLIMPQMDGFQMVRALKTQTELKHTLIIVVSGLDESEIKAKGGLPEDVYVFTKPVNFTDLQNLLRQKRSHKAL